MFNCTRSWEKLGRIYNVWLDLGDKRLCSAGQIFSELPVENKLVICNLSSDEPCQPLEGRFKYSKAISLSLKSNLMVSCNDSLVEVWDLASLDKKHSFKIHESENVKTLAISEDGQNIFVSTYEGFTYAWNLEVRQFIYKINDSFSTHHRCFTIDCKNNLIISISHQDTCLVKAWDYRTGQELWYIDASLHSVQSVMSIAFEGHSNVMLLHSLSGKIIFWDVSSKRVINSFDLNESAERVNFSSEGNFWVVGTRYGDIRIFNLEGSEEHRFIGAHGRCRIEIISILDHQSFISAGWNGTLKLWSK
jgi:WD40 repeat protein